MKGKGRLDLNTRGVRALLNEPGMRRLMKSEAERIKARAGAGHEINLSKGRDRYRAAVSTESVEAKKGEQKNRTLTKAALMARFGG